MKRVFIGHQVGPARRRSTRHAGSPRCQGRPQLSPAFLFLVASVNFRPMFRRECMNAECQFDENGRASASLIQMCSGEACRLAMCNGGFAGAWVAGYIMRARCNIVIIGLEA